MGNITIFTNKFANSNMPEIIKLSEAGNLAPIELSGVASGAKYQSAVATKWNVEATYTPDENLPNEDIIQGLIVAFTELKSENIEAISMSIRVFLLMRESAYFTGNK